MYSPVLSTSPLIPWYRVSLTLTTQFHTHTHTSPQRPFQYQALFVQNYLLLHVWNLIILYPLCLQISTNVHNSLLLHVQNLITVPSLPSDFNWNPVHFISIFVVETILMITPELVFVNIYRGLYQSPLPMLDSFCIHMCCLCSTFGVCVSAVIPSSSSWPVNNILDVFSYYIHHVEGSTIVTMGKSMTKK